MSRKLSKKQRSYFYPRGIDDPIIPAKTRKPTALARKRKEVDNVQLGKELRQKLKEVWEE